MLGRIPAGDHQARRVKCKTRLLKGEGRDENWAARQVYWHKNDVTGSDDLMTCTTREVDHTEVDEQTSLQQTNANDVTIRRAPYERLCVYEMASWYMNEAAVSRASPADEYRMLEQLGRGWSVARTDLEASATQVTHGWRQNLGNGGDGWRTRDLERHCCQCWRNQNRVCVVLCGMSQPNLKADWRNNLLLVTRDLSKQYVTSAVSCSQAEQGKRISITKTWWMEWRWSRRYLVSVVESGNKSTEVEEDKASPYFQHKNLQLLEGSRKNYKTWKKVL